MRILTAAALAGVLLLGGCTTFDPIDMFQDWDLLGVGKKPLPGERRAVFPEGVPGVPQGVPREMVKGYQPPPEAPPPVIEAKQPRQDILNSLRCPQVMNDHGLEPGLFQRRGQIKQAEGGRDFKILQAVLELQQDDGSPAHDVATRPGPR